MTLRSAVELTVEVQSPLVPLVVAELSPLSSDATEDTERENGISLRAGLGGSIYLTQTFGACGGQNIK